MGAPQQALLMLGKLSYNATVLADSPAGFWQLNETSGTTAADSSGNSRDGTYIGSPTLTTTGVVLNGTSQYIDIASSFFDAIGNSNQAYTFEIWGKWTVDTSVAIFFDKGDANAPAEFTQLSVKNISSVPGALQCYANEAGIGSATAQYTGSSSNDGVYHHVVGQRRVTTDGGEETLSLYLDGISRANVAWAQVNSYTSTDNLLIGAYPIGPIAFFPGTLFKAAVYMHSLTDAQVLAHYQARDW